VPGAEHLIVFHLLMKGRASARAVNGARLTLTAGELVVFPHGDPHILANGVPTKMIDIRDELARMAASGTRLSRFGGGGEISRVVSGYLACEQELSRVFLSGLPPLFKVNLGNQTSGRWVQDSISFLANELDRSRLGTGTVLAKLSEVLFVETLRAYIAQRPEEHKGWLAGARDSEVAKTLALMHRSPEYPWTLAKLAKEVGTSRTVLAQRFRHYFCEPPIVYLTRWRLRLGAEMLYSTNHTVAQIAAQVGYESEASFNRAFKRQFEVPPARYRSQLRLTRERGFSRKKVEPSRLHSQVASRRMRSRLTASITWSFSFRPVTTIA
jgi:AraC-like DNA-binding protein